MFEQELQKAQVGPVLRHQQEREPELREPREWAPQVQELQKAQVGPVLRHQQEREPELREPRQ